MFQQALDVVQRRFERHYSDHGIDLLHIWVLMCAREKPSYQKEIAEALKININTMVDIIDQMEDEGLVKRVRNPDNRRETIVQPTAKAIRLMVWVDNQWEDAARMGFHPISLEKLRGMRELAIAIIESET